jgi:predicted ATPase
MFPRIGLCRPPSCGGFVDRRSGRSYRAVMRLVERESQLAALSEHLEEIRSGSGSFVLVAGEAGAGKSALVSEFLADVAVRVAAGSCDGLSTPRPLGPMIEIATQLEVDTALPRDELFDALVGTLIRQSTIVLVEDLHWADDATADFLLYAGRRLDRIPALLIATYRDDEIGPNAPLTRLVGELGRLAAVQRVSVGSLTESGVATMVAGSGLDPAEVFGQTSGNPFFVTECLVAGSNAPGTVRDAVLARAARLSGSGRRVLEAASQLGVRFDTAVLVEASGDDADGVDECVGHGMLTAFGAELGFRHELSRSAIAEQIPPIRRAAVNHAILRALEKRPDVDVARLADHAAAANEAESAYGYSLDAGRCAARLGAHREAVHHYRTALRFASSRAGQRAGRVTGHTRRRVHGHRSDGRRPRRRDRVTAVVVRGRGPVANLRGARRPGLHRLVPRPRRHGPRERRPGRRGSRTASA